jgi:hypothetical protein
MKKPRFTESQIVAVLKEAERLSRSLRVFSALRGWSFSPTCAISLCPANKLGRHSQVVRRGSAKPLFPGSNPGAASKFPLPGDALRSSMTAAPSARVRSR